MFDLGDTHPSGHSSTPLPPPECPWSSRLTEGAGCTLFLWVSRWLRKESGSRSSQAWSSALINQMALVKCLNFSVSPVPRLWGGDNHAHYLTSGPCEGPEGTFGNRLCNCNYLYQLMRASVFLFEKDCALPTAFFPKTDVFPSCSFLPLWALDIDITVLVTQVCSFVLP